MKWFGTSWGAPICDAADHVETPVGRACLRCEAPIGVDDQGFLIECFGAGGAVTEEPFHRDCFLASVGAPLR